MRLAAGYLFPEIGRRRNAYLEANPDAQPIISLGIGDTTMPVPPHILNGLSAGAAALGTKEGYSGYGAEQGQAALREKISKNLYDGKVDASEVFVSDGSKCDGTPGLTQCQTAHCIVQSPVPTDRYLALCAPLGATLGGSR